VRGDGGYETGYEGGVEERGKVGGEAGSEARGVCVCVCVCVRARACVMSLGQSHWLVFGQLYVQSSGAPAVGAKLQIMLIINHKTTKY
jgi:hypothetical protein